MNEDKLDFERRYGGDEKQRIEEIEKEIAAYHDMNAVRLKYGLKPNDNQDTHIRIQMQRLEEMVYGDFIAGIKRRLEYVKSYRGSNQ
jgi:hypothetical protein